MCRVGGPRCEEAVRAAAQRVAYRDARRVAGTGSKAAIGLVAAMPTDLVRGSLTDRARAVSATTDAEALRLVIGSEMTKHAIRAAAMSNPLVDVEVLAETARLVIDLTPVTTDKQRRARTIELDAAMNALDNPSTPDDALLDVADGADRRFRRKAAARLMDRGTYLEDLAASGHVEVREVAAMATTDAEVRDRLMLEDSSPVVREAAVRCAALRTQPLPMEVARDQSLAVRTAAAEVSTDPALLADIARRDEDLRTQGTLLRNRHTGEEALEVLSDRGRREARELLAAHAAQNEPARHLQPAEVVRYRDATPEAITRAYGETSDRRTRMALGLHANAPVDLQIHTATRASVAVRVALAQTETTRSEVLAALASTESTEVMLAVLRSRNVSRETIDALSRSENEAVRTLAQMVRR